MTARRQKGLALANAQKFSALRAIDYRLLSPKPGKRTWTNVAELIVQIQLTSGLSDCDYEVASLAARFFQGTGVSRATLFRAAKVAEDLSLITRRNRVTGRGQLSNLWVVHWDRIVALSGLDEAGLGSPQPSPPSRPLDSPTVGPKSQSEQPESQLAEPESHVEPRAANCDRGRISLTRGVSQTATPFRGVHKGLTREKQPPPPTPSRKGAWRREEEELLRLGMRRARPAVAAAEAAGCLIEDWLAHRRFWAEHQARWHSPIGVLAHRLETLRPGQSPDEGWPPGDPTTESRAQRVAELERYDRRKVARCQWREASEEQRLRILTASGLLEPDASNLVRSSPGEAEDRAINFIAPRLKRAASN